MFPDLKTTAEVVEGFVGSHFFNCVRTRVRWDVFTLKQKVWNKGGNKFEFFVSKLKKADVKTPLNTFSLAIDPKYISISSSKC